MTISDKAFRDAMDVALITGPQTTVAAFPTAQAALRYLIEWESQVYVDPRVSDSPVARELKQLRHEHDLWEAVNRECWHLIPVSDGVDGYCWEVRQSIQGKPDEVICVSSSEDPRDAIKLAMMQKGLWASILNTHNGHIQQHV